MFLKRAVQQIPLQVLLVFFAGVLVLVRFFLLASDIPASCDPFPQLYLRYTALFAALSVLLLSASAFFLQVFMRQTRMVENRKYYPLMLLPLFLALFLQSSDGIPLLFVLLLCGFFLPAIFSVYSRESYRQNAGLVVGMMCGCLGMFYAPMVLLLIFYYVLLLTHRLANFRSLLLPAVGLALWVGYGCIGGYLMAFPMGSLLPRWLGHWTGMGFRLPDVRWPQLVGLAVLLLLYVVTGYRMIRSLYTKNILVRKKCVLLFFLSLFFLLFSLLVPEGNLFPLCGFLVSLVMILCEEEASLRNRMFHNLCFFVIWAMNLIVLFLL
jgi:hypothetical protein